MSNPTVNTPVPTQPSIKTPKEPFRKDMIEVSNKVKTELNANSSRELAARNSQDPATIMVASTLLSPFNPSAISDKDLLKLCQEYSGNSRTWKRKFEELLPEVLKRHLYKGRKFTSIHEFSAKLCGLSHESVDNVIRVYEQLEDKPILRSLVVEFGWSKLRIVASIATKETDASWAEKVRVLPSSSLATFVRDLKRQEEVKRLGDGAQIARNSQQVNQELSSAGQRNFVETSAKNENKTIALCQSTEQSKLTDQQSLPHHQFPIRPIFRAENLQFTGNHCQTDIYHLTLTQLVPPLMESAESENEYIKQSALITDIGQSQNNQSTISFKLNPETEFRLRKLKARLEKGKKEKISFNRLFETMLGIIENKEMVAKKSRNPYGMAPLKLCWA